jgi:hypothetical protein
MKILAAIPHYFHPGTADAGDDRWHASLGQSARHRVEALTNCIAGFHQLYGENQRIIDIRTKAAREANTRLAARVDIVVCTTGDRHQIGNIPLPRTTFHHRPTNAEPMLLGFECHAVLREGLGAYDYFVYLEDDLIVRDPWLFTKLAWFNQHVGDQALLQANRFEVSGTAVAHKAYIDGDLADRMTLPFQDRRERPTLSAVVMGMEVVFHRPSNPHSGSFFLNASQMSEWAARPDFLDRDTGFIGPLESAATLGIMRAFQVYKATPENASFLEIEHFGTGFISQLRLDSR